ncbi:MAG: hypothetical protein SNJ52_04605 [Verrucomicrobiia bacterium]
MLVALTATGLLVAAEADPSKGLAKGDVTLSSAGPLTFGPNGILFAADPLAATLYALDTADTKPADSREHPKVEAINEKIAKLLGIAAKEVRFGDLAVNPISGNAYLSVARGTGAKAAAVILKVDRKGNLSELSLQNIPHAKVQLPNANDKSRSEAITHIAFLNNRLYVAGLSNEEFASNLRSIPYPFEKTDRGASIEIFHGAHGKFETRSPIRVFAPYKIGEEDTILAAYTCTPLVRLPVKALEPGKKIKAVTVAELGNRNRPLSMIVYRKADKDYVLLANSARGLMKINLDGIDSIPGITERVKDKAGLKYETIAGKEGVQKLDAFDKEYALILVRNGDKFNLETMELP